MTIKTQVNRWAVLSLAAPAILAALVVTLPAQAQDRRNMREHEGERARFQTQHWAWDSRYNHNHYYPAVGYAVNVLPAGHQVINYRGGRLFFHSGVWFRFSAGRYLVIRPPIGALIPVLPMGYTQVYAGGAPYYYANDVYYAPTPQGYAVVEAPQNLTWQEQGQPPAQYPQAAPPPQYPQAAPPPPPPPPPAPQYGGAPIQSGQGMWYYCEPTRGYYPHVQTCVEPWRSVPAGAPPR